MSDLPAVSGREAIAAFVSAGFEVSRVKGSHHILKKSGHRNRLCIPVHGSKSLGRGLLRAQIKAAGLTDDEFRGYLNRS